MIRYNSWPIGKLSKDMQRTELYQIKELGYLWDDPRDVIEIFENKVAKFAGSRYAVSCDCCTHGLFLVLKYFNGMKKITIPKHTYISVPMLIEQAGYTYKFEDLEWSGEYQLSPYLLYDSAVRWTKGMYLGGDSIQVISFQIKKRIPIGRGGMILTNDKVIADKLRLMSYDGRDLDTAYDNPNHIKCVGYHFYMTPEDAARGILLMDKTSEINEDSGGWKNYPDLSQLPFFKGDL